MASKKDDRFEVRLSRAERELGDQLARDRGLESFSELIRVLIAEEKVKASGMEPSPDALNEALRYLSKVAARASTTSGSENQAKKTRRRRSGGSE